MAAHSGILAWKIPCPMSRSLVGYSPSDHQELNMTLASEQQVNDIDSSVFCL